MSQSMEKSLRLLTLVASGNRSLGTLAEASSMPKSTVHRLTSVLIGQGFLRHDAQEYRLGYKLLELGEIVRQELYLPVIARKYMEETAQRTLETVHLGELDGKFMVYLEKIEGQRGVQVVSRAGLRIPAQTTSIGKVLISSLPKDEWRNRLLQLPATTPSTVTDLDAVAEELDQVRRQGYALDREESQVGIRCVASPVFDAKGRVKAAVSISGATIYISEERQRELVPEVQRCALQISRELGGERFAAIESP